MKYVEELTKWFQKKIGIHERVINEAVRHNRGEIWYVNFGINIGSEFSYSRPAMIFQKKEYTGGDTLFVIPITKYIDDKVILSCEMRIPQGLGGLSMDSILKIGNMRTISKRRLGGRIGKITDSKMLDIVDQKVIEFLGIKNAPDHKSQKLVCEETEVK